MEKVASAVETLRPSGAGGDALHSRWTGRLLVVSLLALGLMVVICGVALGRLFSFANADRIALRHEPPQPLAAKVGQHASPQAPMSASPGPERAIDLGPTSRAASFKREDPVTRPLTTAQPLARCAPTFRLSGSVVNERRPERSIAAVQVPGGTRVLRVGRRLGDHTLVELHSDLAIFRRTDHSLCVVPVYGEGPARAPTRSPAPATTQARPAKSPKAAIFSERELSEGVRVIGADTYAVSRELLERAFANMTSLRRSARFRIKRGSERAEGIEISGLRKSSPLKALGLAKGDVLRKLNGLNLTDPADALQAWTLLKTQGRLSLAIDRAGAPRTMTYQLD